MKKNNAVVFDLDSTLVKIEGLDWLASLKGEGKKVQELTEKSMDGHLNFHDAMVQKMKFIAPSYSDMKKLGEAYCQNIVDGAKEAINELISLGFDVWIVTGNFPPAVSVLAKKLGIPSKNIICNKIFFGQKGKYLGFDEENELSKNGGKARKISRIKIGGKIILIGDGATDLEAKKSVSIFIGFGGVVEREIVKQNSDYYIGEPSLRSLPKIIRKEFKL